MNVRCSLYLNYNRSLTVNIGSFSNVISLKYVVTPSTKLPDFCSKLAGNILFHRLWNMSKAKLSLLPFRFIKIKLLGSFFILNWLWLASLVFLKKQNKSNPYLNKRFLCITNSFLCTPNKPSRIIKFRSSLFELYLNLVIICFLAALWCRYLQRLSQ